MFYDETYLNDFNCKINLTVQTDASEEWLGSLIKSNNNNPPSSIEYLSRKNVTRLRLRIQLSPYCNTLINYTKWFLYMK